MAARRHLRGHGAASAVAQKKRSESGARERGMSTNLHIVRKALIYVFLVIVLTVELTASGTAAFAQNYGTGMQSAPPRQRGTRLFPVIPGRRCSRVCRRKPATRSGRGSARLCWECPYTERRRLQSISLSVSQIPRVRWSISGTSAMARYPCCQPGTCSTFIDILGHTCARSI